MGKWENEITGNRRLIVTSGVVLLLMVGMALLYSFVFQPIFATRSPLKFDGERALTDVEIQITQGPRIHGAPGHTFVRRWIANTLEGFDWEVTEQLIEWRGFPVANVIARRGQGERWIIIAAHYDTRMRADQDPNLESRDEPVVGANDGASGVALLLELGRTIPMEIDAEIWLVFFDEEDNGGIAGKSWIMGSSAFVDALETHPDAVVILDMVGDRNLNIFVEQNSELILTSEIWSVAAELGYSEYFIPIPKHRMIDDHIPFREVGIPAVDVIDFDYPYWHTTEDTIDKVSAQSLQIVGEVILAWLTGNDGE